MRVSAQTKAATRERILQAYPHLEDADIDASLEYAARKLQDDAAPIVTA